jgi:hypothetical protein
MKVYPEYKRLPVETLVSKIPVELYQRERTSVVRDIVAAGWNPSLAGVLLVSEVTGHVMDGGNRARAAAEINAITDGAIPELPALVYPDLTLEEEARISRNYNVERHTLPLKDGHRVEVFYKERIAVDTERVKLLIDRPAGDPKRAPIGTYRKAWTLGFFGALEQLVPTLRELFDENEMIPRAFLAGAIYRQHFMRDLVEGLAHDRLLGKGAVVILDTIHRHQLDTMIQRRKIGLPAKWSDQAAFLTFALNHHYRGQTQSPKPHRPFVPTIPKEPK